MVVTFNMGYTLQQTATERKEVDLQFLGRGKSLPQVVDTPSPSLSSSKSGKGQNSVQILIFISLKRTATTPPQGSKCGFVS